MQAVWSTLHPARVSASTTLKHLLPAGEEFYGTVIKSGVNEKTVTVQVAYKYWHRKYKKYFAGKSTFQVHDEENYCVSGDKVVIKRCQKVTPTKYYYVRNIVIPAGRDQSDETDQAMEYLQEIRKQLVKQA